MSDSDYDSDSDNAVFEFGNDDEWLKLLNTINVKAKKLDCDDPLVIVFTGAIQHSIHESISSIALEYNIPLQQAIADVTVFSSVLSKLKETAIKYCKLPITFALSEARSFQGPYVVLDEDIRMRTDDTLLVYLRWDS